MTPFYASREVLFGMLQYVAKISSEIVGNSTGFIEFAPVIVYVDRPDTHFRSCGFLESLINFPPIMEPEDRLSSSQMPATGSHTAHCKVVVM
jgi:hypothetical protein